MDIGAREQIFAVIRASAATGRSVLCASADHEQLAAVCDRVLVFSDGVVVAELTGLDVTKDRITERCLTGTAPTEAVAAPAAASRP